MARAPIHPNLRLKLKLGERIHYFRPHSGEQRFGVFEYYEKRSGHVYIWARWGTNDYASWTDQPVYRDIVGRHEEWRIVYFTGLCHTIKCKPGKVKAVLDFDTEPRRVGKKTILTLTAGSKPVGSALRIS